MAIRASAAGQSAKTDKSSTESSTGSTAWQSRAVIRLIEAGSAAECPHCMERVKFRARHRDQLVICNVYEDGIWKRVEQYHLDCYADAETPYGEPIKG